MQNIVQNFFFFVLLTVFFLRRFREIKYAKQKNRKKKEFPVSHWIPLEKINLKVYLNFSILCLFFSLQMSNFWPMPLNPAQEKGNPKVHSLKFTSFLFQVMSLVFLDIFWIRLYGRALMVAQCSPPMCDINNATSSLLFALKPHLPSSEDGFRSIYI